MRPSAPRPRWLGLCASGVSWSSGNTASPSRSGVICTEPIRCSAGTLADVRCQVLKDREELVPPRLRVAALTPGEVGGESFGVDLPPNRVEGELVPGQDLALEDQVSVIAVGGQRGLDGLVERLRAATLPPGLVRFPGRYPQPPSGFARFHSPSAVPAIGLDE